MSDMADLMKDLWDEHEYVHVSDWEGLIFAVNKLGGGTLHNEYVGAWEVTVYGPLGEWVGEISFTTGVPHTHAWVARAATGDYTG